MKTVTIFEKGDEVFFLKEGSKYNVNGTEIVFYSVKEGVVTDSSNNTTTIEVNGLATVHYEIENQYVFASYEEAKTRAKVLNSKHLAEIQENLDIVKKLYLL